MCNQHLVPECAPAFSAIYDEIFLTLLAGVHDANSVLSLLRGIPHLVKRIFQLSTNEFWWKRCVRLPDSAVDRRIFDLIRGKERNGKSGREGGKASLIIPATKYGNMRIFCIIKSHDF